MSKLRQHTYGKLFVCEICRLTYLDEYQYKAHMSKGKHNRPHQYKNNNGPKRRPKGLNKNNIWQLAAQLTVNYHYENLSP